MPPTPIWLDCDTGHDDAFALLLSACHPNLNLLGVSTIYGNAPLHHTTRNTLAILKAIGREDIPVYQGVSQPFCRPVASAADIHGESGLDGTTCLPIPTATPKTDMIAVEATYKALISQPPNTAWLVATGSLTNTALLFSIYPSLATHIAGLSIMGGAIGSGFSSARQSSTDHFGNWTPWAEFNIWLDPESASAVFSNPTLSSKTTLMPLDLTHQFLATEPIQAMMLHGKDGKSSSMVRKLFHEILTFFAKTYSDVFGLVEGPPTHDPLAVATAIVPEEFDDRGGERFEVKVVTEGNQGSTETARNGSSQRGRTVATLLPKGSEGVRIPRGLEKEKLWKLLEECLGRAEKAVAGA